MADLVMEGRKVIPGVVRSIACLHPEGTYRAMAALKASTASLPAMWNKNDVLKTVRELGITMVNPLARGLVTATLAAATELGKR